jgi:hypothetical protein
VADIEQRVAETAPVAAPDAVAIEPVDAEPVVTETASSSVAKAAPAEEVVPEEAEEPAPKKNIFKKMLSCFVCK